MKTYVAPLLQSTGKPITTSDGPPIYWLDELLDGGLHRPAQLGRPLVVLLAGPPGAGKSLLAQTICYNRAENCCKLDESGAAPPPPDEGTSLYITTEVPP